ncbi:cAMP-binding domain of CRP or a regulatory subunit of cAMP-dependent protein kinases [Roseovarius tolerans]|uniref:cAMP-binding domain of CRP or a regulatory subunit of cAMP-dependent protein kinases n=1 Tax=Roseovarius tolerans TaxID=74031 RepID=A0A1H8DGQ0_9RHOB|nr:Crp/Fnr family transcriptional regulator [Roseovarius tolerans]SEN06356.1 cAMP-binding domain of CRP or a regulatory subunit of cAMP-dependent protein kinases [Roseovarius tolerans]
MKIAASQKERFLRACPLFDGLEPEVITRMATWTRGVALAKGEALFHEGDPSDGLYVLCSGLVQVSITDADGNTLVLALPEHGAPLGEMTLVTPDPRSATVTALEDSVLLHVGTGTMVALLAEEPALARHLIAFLSRRLRQSNDSLHRFAFDNLQRRLLQKLTELGLQHGDLRPEGLSLGRKFSQTALAEMLGVTREAVNKQLKLLQDQGDIEIETGVIRLCHPAEIIKNTPNL